MRKSGLSTSRLHIPLISAGVPSNFSFINKNILFLNWPSSDACVQHAMCAIGAFPIDGRVSLKDISFVNELFPSEHFLFGTDE